MADFPLFSQVKTGSVCTKKLKCLLFVQKQGVKLEPDSHALAYMLGEISTSEDAAGRGMLSVVVVHKGSDGQPGKGFFELAKKLGYDVSNTERFWIKELNRVYHYWSNQSR